MSIRQSKGTKQSKQLYELLCVPWMSKRTFHLAVRYQKARNKYSGRQPTGTPTLTQAHWIVIAWRSPADQLSTSHRSYGMPYRKTRRSRVRDRVRTPWLLLFQLTLCNQPGKSHRILQILFLILSKHQVCHLCTGTAISISCATSRELFPIMALPKERLVWLGMPQSKNYERTTRMNQAIIVTMTWWSLRLQIRKCIER